METTILVAIWASGVVGAVATEATKGKVAHVTGNEFLDKMIAAGISAGVATLVISLVINRILQK